MTHSILIVEDRREVLRVLEHALESLGQRFIITGVPSGEEALLEARLSQVDLLITDIRLPGMSGLELYTRIRILRPQVKTFLLTGLTDEETHTKAAGAGADAFFTKPVDLAEFLDTVVRVLNLKMDGPVTIPTPPTPEIEDPPPSGTLSDRLAQLRQDLHAETVLLVDEAGQVMARAGDLRDPNTEPRLLRLVADVLQAGTQLSRLLKSRPTGRIHHFPGATYDLIIAPLGEGRGLVAAAPPDPNASLENAARTAAEDSAGILAQIGLPNIPTEPEAGIPFSAGVPDAETADPAQPDEALASLFEDGPIEDVREQAHSFWENSAETPEPGAQPPNSLSYEQAVRLGLAPESEESQ